MTGPRVAHPTAADPVGSAPGPVTGSSPRRLLPLGRGVLRQTLVEPVRSGRLRDDGWPYGLRAAVGAGYVMFAVAAVAVVVSGPVRQQARLVLSPGLTQALPDTAVWPLVVLLSFVTATLVVAALHGPWWLRLVAVLYALGLMTAWSVRDPGLTGGWRWVLLGVASMVALVVVVLLRGRRSFAWWELPVVWLLVGTALGAGVLGMRYARTFGYDQVPQTLQLTVALLGFFALPAATVAGAAVAEITVRATVAATRGVQQLARPRAAHVVLGTLLVLRLTQLGLQLTDRDPVSQGVNLLVPALLVTAGSAVAGALLLRTARRRGGVPVVAELADDLAAVAFPVAVVLFAVNVPLQLVAAVVPALATLDPDGLGAQAWTTRLPDLVASAVDPSRALLGLVLLGSAVRAARRGRAGRALVLGCLGVVLVTLARRLVLGDLAAGATDPDTLNLLATAVVVVAVVVTLLRRRLSPARAAAFAGVLVLSALFAYRTVLADPLGELLGFSGAALLLLGLTWDLLTGSGWGNGTSRAFPRPTRVLLVLSSSLLTMTVLAWAALVRDGSTTVFLDPYAEFGDLLFGTGLLAGAVVAVLDAAWRDQPVA